MTQNNKLSDTVKVDKTALNKIGCSLYVVTTKVGDKASDGNGRKAGI